MNRTVLRPRRTPDTTEHLTHPRWCTRHTVTASGVEHLHDLITGWRAPGDDAEITVSASRYDETPNWLTEPIVGTADVLLSLVNQQTDERASVALSPAAARQLAGLLLRAAELVDPAGALTVPAQSAANTITGSSGGDGRDRCAECGAWFDPDSSPYSDLCGPCAERFDGGDAA